MFYIFITQKGVFFIYDDFKLNFTLIKEKTKTKFDGIFKKTF